MDVPFARTKCACFDCTTCCKRQPGALSPDDFERIRLYLQETEEQARKHFWASPGALIRTDDGTKRVGTVTPRMRKGRCVFLDDNNRCKIHSVAPFGCSMFDTHMNRQTAHERSVFLVRWQASSRAYSDLRYRLPYSRTYKPNPY
jgi:Fe-S-cluster containining protein